MKIITEGLSDRYLVRAKIILDNGREFSVVQGRQFLEGYIGKPGKTVEIMEMNVEELAPRNHTTFAELIQILEDAQGKLSTEDRKALAVFE